MNSPLTASHLTCWSVQGAAEEAHCSSWRRQSLTRQQLWAPPKCHGWMQTQPGLWSWLFETCSSQHLSQGSPCWRWHTGNRQRRGKYNISYVKLSKVRTHTHTYTHTHSALPILFSMHVLITTCHSSHIIISKQFECLSHIHWWRQLIAAQVSQLKVSLASVN